MADDGNKFRRVDVGFKGGAVLGVRLQEDAYEALRKALGSGAERMHELHSEDATVTLDLSEVVYIRLDTERGRVGF
jgi:hypothetical protein